VISWQAFGNETENVLNQRIDSPSKFAPRFEANPSLKDVCSFGPEGIKLKTKKSTAQTNTGGNTGADFVGKAAKRATDKRRS
jgi:hypothetical protein